MSLVQVSPTNWPAIRSLYATEWPKHIVVYNALDGYINWITEKPSLDIHLYCLNGDWQGGTFILQVFS